jgi:NTP pyrophosphatase (non-canonical NTP hydrolase)
MIKSQLSFDTLRKANISRNKFWDSGNALDASFRGVEFAGEAGEVCNVIKKLERERLGLRGSRDTVAHLAEELADTIICADLIAMAYRIDLAHAISWKFNATSENMKLPVMIGAGDLVIEEEMK